jgi:hypothetical protein
MRHSILLVTLLLALVQPGFAQDTSARYAGQWQVASGDGGTGTCTVNLATNSGMFGLWATSLGCLGPMAMVNGWRSEGGNLHLLGFDGSTVATFSPNGSMLDGRFSDGAPAVLVPRNGQNVTSLNQPAPQNCVRRPDTGLCAAGSDIAVPSAFPLWVKGLRALTIRALPTMASDRLGETALGQCFMIDSCQDTPEGTRCHLAPGQNLPTGYVLKHYTDNAGTFVAFQNFC